MNCPAIRELLPWYPSGLAPEEAAQVALHLRACPSCQEEFAQTQALRTFVRDALEAMPELRTEIWDRVALRSTGLPLGRLHLGDEMVGLSLGLWVRGKTLPVGLELSLLGKRLPIFAYAGGVR